MPSTHDHYRTVKPVISLPARLAPSLIFYCHLFCIILRASRVARAGGYSSEEWVNSSLAVIRQLEECGMCLDVAGMDQLRQINGPVVFIGNHMSMMETLVLPAIIEPIKPVTFVVKESLLSYPVFKHVMRARQPIAVTRTNPRQDLQTVLGEGREKLASGISIIVFPQTTRSHHFEPTQMSSIGVKLAKKAGVPIIPLALKTDSWQNGRWFKDFGRLDVGRTAFFAFGPPLSAADKEGQMAVNRFIEEKLSTWQGASCQD